MQAARGMHLKIDCMFQSRKRKRSEVGTFSVFFVVSDRKNSILKKFIFLEFKYVSECVCAVTRYKI